MGHAEPVKVLPGGPFEALIGACLVAALTVLPPTTADAQTAQGGADPRESIVRQWELRGVAIAGTERLAVLEHRSSGRQQVLRVGDGLAHGVSLITIGADRVVLDSDGTGVTLRLGHGGQARVVRPGALVRPRWPPSITTRMRGRR